MNSAGIDTSALLTMLGLAAAVWAVVPGPSRLGFRLSLNWLDWVVFWVTLAIIHGLFFEPVLMALGFPILGPWLWGFEKSSTQYLLFLALAAYVYFRSRRTKLTRWNLGLFDELTTSLLFAGKFEELCELLERHLHSALDLATSAGWRSKWSKRIRPRVRRPRLIRLEAGSLTLVEEKASNLWSGIWCGFRRRLAEWIAPPEATRRKARVVVKRLLSSRRLVAHLALARPYFCVSVMERAEFVEESFQDAFFEALLADESSVLYSELKNNENFGAGGRRLALPEENRLLRFYCADPAVAARLGVYRSVGEAVLARVDADDVLEKKLNGRLLTFHEVGKYHDPVYAGIWFFRIMVLEGLHQRLPDHLWLHYMPHFALRLVDRARDVRPDDENHEFPSPLAYLLNEIVSATTVWVRDAEILVATDDAVDSEQTDGRHVYIAFEAAEAIGRVLHAVLNSPHLSTQLKKDLLSLALSTMKDLTLRPHLVALADAMGKHIIEPYGFSEKLPYLYILQQCFQKQEPLLRTQLRRFDQELTAAIASAKSDAEDDAEDNAED